MKKLLVVFVALMLIGAACGDDDDTTTKASTPSGGGARTIPVRVDPKVDEFTTAFTAFFPKEVTVHPGDTVTFTEHFSGEPHTVTFGTLVDAGLAAADKQAPDAEEEPPELAKIPNLFPNGPGDAVQTAGQPCFLATGELPTDGAACPKVTQPAFTGKQPIYSSGFLADDDTFTVKLTDDVAPGTYRWFCEIHRAEMQGKITVVGSGESSDTAEAAKLRGDKELATQVAQMQPIADKLQTLTAATAQAGGVAGPESPGIVAEFGPKDLSVPVGGTVTWDVQGPHTITFNGTEELRTFVSRAPDGSVHLNPASFTASGGPGNGPDTPPPDKPTVLDGKTWDGTGVRNSGILLGFGPPGILKFTLTFSKAGTYKYQCNIHPDMEGTVKVG